MDRLNSIVPHWRRKVIQVRSAGVTLLVILLAAAPAFALIERLTPLQTLLDDADHVFVAKIEAVDAQKPSAVLVWDKHLKGETPLRRLPINLTGDKEKHTPEFLKRIAPKISVVLFVTELDDKLLALGYTNGCWFQLIGTKAAEGKDVRWAFTHCEIYLRRTFKGTTTDLVQTVTDAVAGKKKPPKPDAKEKPGFGPEVPREEETKPATASVLDRGTNLNLQFSIFNFQSPFLLWFPVLGVVALPFLAPLAALLQLLFPGLLRDQWKQYRIAISVMMTQSSLIAVHWIVLRWFVKERPWWLGDEALWWSVVGVAACGAIAAVATRIFSREPYVPSRPAPVEYIAVGSLLVAGVAWGGYLWLAGGSPFDQMAVVTIGACAALVHLLWRKRRAAPATQPADVLPSRTPFSTELVLLSGLVVAGIGLGLYLQDTPSRPAVADDVRAEWPLFRGDVTRRGSVASDDAGPVRPAVLWSFDPRERKGRISLHSSPTIVDGQVFVGAMHQVQTVVQGAVFAVNAADGRKNGDQPLAPGDRLWRFTAEGTLKPVFSSPSIAGGYLYFGEGYHEDQGCRLFGLDPKHPERPLWSYATTSHVESSPCVIGDRIYFGAGDDGIFCLQLPDPAAQTQEPNQPPQPKKLWQVEQIHVDGSPVVQNGRLFVGSVLGDIYKDFHALAVDADNGKILWRTPAPMALPASPACAADRVVFGLGNGKVDTDSDPPSGAIWCLDSKTGNRIWDIPTANSVMATPAISGDNVYCGSRDQHCYCLALADGGVNWKTDLGNPIVASPTVAAGRAYVVTVNGVVVCLNAKDGAELWRVELDVPEDDVYASPVLAEGRLYLAAGGKLWCLGDRPQP